MAHHSADGVFAPIDQSLPADGLARRAEEPARQPVGNDCHGDVRSGIRLGIMLAGDERKIEHLPESLVRISRRDGDFLLAFAYAEARFKARLRYGKSLESRYGFGCFELAEYL